MRALIIFKRQKVVRKQKWKWNAKWPGSVRDSKEQQPSH